MTRALWLLVLAGCINEGEPPPNHVFDVDVAWQVRCPDCTEPQHAIDGTIDNDSNPNMFQASCGLNQGTLYASFGREAPAPEPAYSLTVSMGYDPATGFDLTPAACQVVVAETDRGAWSAACSALGDCHIEPTLADGALSFTLRCAGMTEFWSDGGSTVTVEGGGLAGSEVSARIAPCSL